ncbi:MAG: hypothetical protein ACRDH6_04770 [Actinomycetota bacterium]
MRPKKLFSSVLSAALLAALILTSAPAGAKKGAPVVVGKDPAGDWAVQGTAVGSAGTALAQDLLEAAIGMADAGTLSFVLTVAELPAQGGWPEVTRYIWDLDVDGDYAELDGKFTNYSRGACDPTAGSCPPPRDPGMAPFAVRANCEVVQNVTTCEEVGIVQATFDASAGTITIPVPLDLVGAKAGSKIAGGVSDFLVDGNIGAFPSAFVSNNGGPHDVMQVTKVFVVPGGKKGKK